jgi:solute carrier family 25 oxoglutarate transporter 11
VSKTAQPYVVGGSAAVIAAFCTHPVDLVKVHIQLAGQSGKSANPFSIAKQVVATEGVGGLWAG